MAERATGTCRALAQSTAQPRRHPPTPGALALPPWQQPGSDSCLSFLAAAEAAGTHPWQEEVGSGQLWKPYLEYNHKELSPHTP